MDDTSYIYTFPSNHRSSSESYNLSCQAIYHAMEPVTNNEKKSGITRKCPFPTCYCQISSTIENVTALTFSLYIRVSFAFAFNAQIFSLNALNTMIDYPEFVEARIIAGKQFFCKRIHVLGLKSCRHSCV